ncbi:MAG TPA: UDP-N-acetylmuramoyl-L-alanine--D-glutamate ligase [Candidatus Saccharimonadales bacterium]|nr:UDP-N-acetylmuramoyl-L-alanine--D-glutamate ligase [Candidatus Saccharimonadales bacterium]
MRIAILGYGLQGKSAYEHWKNGNDITVCDKDESLQLPSDVKKQLGSEHLKNLNQYDLIVRSPIVYPLDIVKANTPEILDKVTTNTNEFFKVCPSKNIIGVTGTKGKGTTSTLIAKMLEASGKKVHLGGNIGIPPLDMLKDVQPDDYVVLELANFQLIDIKYSPHIALCLMVVDEHLDWHANSQEYIAAKQQLFAHQIESDIAIYYGLNDYSQHIASVSKGQKIPYMKHPGADVIEGKVTIDGQEICDVSDIKLLGKHNWQNICAAVTAVWQITQDKEAIKSVATTFAGLEHRLELVREVNSVKYYNDTYGSTPETATVAIEAFEQPKVLILGGSKKVGDFDRLAETIAKNNIRHIILVGNTTNPNFETAAPEIESALKSHNVSNYSMLVKPGGPSMDKIVQAAKDAAHPGDVVLLSTACASFDIFKNYKVRGEEFKKVVQALV